jgi:hypothetical protein
MPKLPGNSASPDSCDAPTFPGKNLFLQALAESEIRRSLSPFPVYHSSVGTKN